MRERLGWAKLAVLAGLGAAVMPNATLSFLVPLHASRLALPAASLQSLYTAYWIGMVLAALPMAALTARLGLRPAFLTAVASLALVAPATVLPLELAPLIGLRFLQGALTAWLLITGMSLLRRLYGEERLGVGLGLMELAGFLALVPLQALAGLMFAWAGNMGVLVPTALLTVAALSLGWSGLPRSERVGPGFDGVGAILAVLCLGLLLAAHQVMFPRPVLALLLLALGLLAGAGWLWQQWRRSTPLLPLDLLARPARATTFGAALLGGAALAMAEMGVHALLDASSSLPPEWQTGLYPMLAVSAVAAAVLGGWRGSPALPRIGAGLLALGLGGLAMLPPDGAAGLALGLPILAMLGYGIGSGLFRVGNRLALLRASPVERSPAAAGLLVLALGLGSLLAPTVTVLLPGLFLPTETVLSPRFWLALAAGAALAAALLSPSRPAGGQVEGRDPIQPP